MPTPSEQLLTRTVYATDGVTTNWDFSFSGGYLDKSHVKAFTEATTGQRTEIIVTGAMLVGPFQVRIAPALATGLTLTVYRDTPKDLPLVDFTDESGFSEIALDTNAKQAVFIAAETTDTVNTSSSYDAEQAASQAAIAAGEAQTSATAAAASALLAANEADASEVSAAASAVSAVNSAASAVNSANSAASSSAAATAVFNANTTTYTRTLLDDTTASAARATLGAATAGPLPGSGITGAAASGANTDITSLGAVASINGGQLAGLRNRIINGGMQVAQRGDTYALTAASAYGSVDRFFAYQVASAAGIFKREALSSLSGFRYTTRLGRNSGSAGVSAIVMGQVLETDNCIDLQGKTITLSFYATVGANFSAAGNNISVQIGTGTGINQTSANFYTGWTGGAAALSTSQPITGSWVRYSFTATLPSNMTQLGFTVSYVPVGTAGANDSFYITGVQLELGSVATPFEHRPYGMELALCQRYFEKSYAQGTVPGSAAISSFRTNIQSSSQYASINCNFAVSKRATPTCVVYSPSNGAQGNMNADAEVFSASVTATETGILVYASNVTTTVNNFLSAHWTASAEL